MIALINHNYSRRYRCNIHVNNNMSQRYWTDIFKRCHTNSVLTWFPINVCKFHITIMFEDYRGNIHRFLMKVVYILQVLNNRVYTLEKKTTLVVVRWQCSKNHVVCIQRRPRQATNKGTSRNSYIIRSIGWNISCINTSRNLQMLISLWYHVLRNL